MGIKWAAISLVLSRNGTETEFRPFPLEPGLHFLKPEIREEKKKIMKKMPKLSLFSVKIFLASAPFVKFH